MNKWQRLLLFISIFICISYALHVLLGFKLMYPLFSQHLWMEKVYAFISGVCGFCNILLLKKEEF